jgi:hypothetical protein
MTLVTATMKGMGENGKGKHHIGSRSRLMRRGTSEMKKFESVEIRDAGRSVRELQVEVTGEPNTLSGDCPECGAPLLRVSLEDLAPDDNGTSWTRRFIDHSSDLGPGRYRCANCLSEWWRFPASVAS